MANLGVYAGVETCRSLRAFPLRYRQALLACGVMRIASADTNRRERRSWLDLAALRALLADVVAKRRDVIDATMLSVLHQFKVARRIVQAIAVDVVNLFSWLQRSSEHTFHDDAMLQSLALSARSPNFSVSVRTNVTASTWASCHMANCNTFSLGFIA